MEVEILFTLFHTGSVMISGWLIKVVGVNLMVVSVVATVTAVMIAYWLVNWNGNSLV